MLHPHLYFVCFALAGAVLGASLIVGVRGRSAPAGVLGVFQSYLTCLGVPFAFGFGAAGIASEALGETEWPDSLYHAVAAGTVLAGLSLFVALVRKERAQDSAEGHLGSAGLAPSVDEAVEQRDDAGRNEHE